MGNRDNLFFDAYYENIGLQTEEILETSPVASALLKFMSDRNEWNGNRTELLEQLDEILGEETSKNKYWPKTSSVLSRRINEVKTNLREVGIFIKEGEKDPVTRVKTIVITKASNMGKMPFEQFEPFDRRECPKDVHHETPNGTDGISHKPPENTGNKDVSSKIEANTRSKGENQNSDACHGTPNGMNGMNGILHNPDGPAPQNISNDISNEIVNNSNSTNPKLPPYVYRLGHSDRFACKLCNIRDDKWGMIKHYHPEGEDILTSFAKRTIKPIVLTFSS